MTDEKFQINLNDIFEKMELVKTALISLIFVSAIMLGVTIEVGISLFPLFDKVELLITMSFYLSIVLVIGRIFLSLATAAEYFGYEQGRQDTKADIEEFGLSHVIQMHDISTTETNARKKIIVALLFLVPAVTAYIFYSYVFLSAHRAYVAGFIDRQTSFEFGLGMTCSIFLVGIWLSLKGFAARGITILWSKGYQGLLISVSIVFFVFFGSTYISFLRALEPTTVIGYVDKNQKNDLATIVARTPEVVIAFINGRSHVEFIPWHTIRTLHLPSRVFVGPSSTKRLSTH
ncbi:MAG: hypothetical protein JKX93_08290 [Rhizobiaceae bacterium]|nr:hypothetical protein [Rhizobiaceae bacterium]